MMCVTPGVSYLLAHQTRAESDTEAGAGALALIWRDSTGRTIETTREVVPTSPQGFHQFSTLGVAPATAATVELSITADDGAVAFNALSLRELATGAAAR